MCKSLLQKIAILQIALWLSACAESPHEKAAPAPPFDRADDNVARFLHNCHVRFERSDRQIRHAGTHDATFPPIAGFPYMRNSRLMESYAQQADTDRDIFEAWSLEMRDNDSYSREAELRNLGLRPPELTQVVRDLRYCAVWLSNLELDEKKNLHRLVANSRIPDEQTWRGPIARFIWTRSDIRREAARRQAEIRNDFVQPVSQLTAPGPLVVWQPPASADPGEVANLDYSKFRHDQTGRVGLTPEMWDELAHRFAPRWAIEQGGNYDKIAAASWTSNGPDVNPAKPVVYYLTTYARSGRNPLIQLNYCIFFSAHVSPGDPHTDDGHLDGLIWRVTLDPDGKPIVYDVIHTSGFDQMWFPLAAAKLRPAQRPDGETPFIPQTNIPADFLIRVQSGTHNLRRLLAPSEVPAGATVETYELKPYEDLYEVPVTDQATHNFFDPTGFVDGTRRKGTTFYHALGIRNAGMLREWGKHPISLTGNLYFDDPYLIEAFFQLPTWPPPPPMP